MTASARDRWRCRGLLLAWFAVCAAWLLHLDYRRKISTDILDLVPRDERAPELALVRDLASNLQARVVLLAVAVPGDPGRTEAAARTLAQTLARDPAFAEALPIADLKVEEKLGRALYRDRSALLLPTWLGEEERAFAAAQLPSDRLAAWAAERAASNLESFLNRPEAMSLQPLIPSDPLLLLPNLVDKAQSLAPGGKEGSGGLVWARTAAPPLSEAGQAPVFAAVDRAVAAVRAADPAAVVQWTGVARFAAASRSGIEREIKTLNTWSLVAVLLIGCLFVRRLWKLGHLVPVVLSSLVGAATVSTLLFPRLHILVFAIGSLLTGVAIDYGFYIFMQPYRDEREDYSGKLHRLLQPLLASCLTTVAGFSLLLFSELPLIRQVGLYVAAGLLSALGAAMVYFGQLKRPYLEARDFARGGVPPQPRATRRGRRVHVAVFFAAAVALVGPWFLRWKDDVKELDLAQPALLANDQAVRGRFGDQQNRTAYLTFGTDLAEARANLARFQDFLHGRDAGSDALSLALIFPSRQDYAATARRLEEFQGFPAEFRRALTRHGFLPESFGPFFVEWDATRRSPPTLPYDALYRRLEPALGGPMRLLYSGPTTGRAWFVTLVDHADAGPFPPGLHTFSANELQNLNSLFTRYRWSALRLSLIGLALIIASVFLIYPARRAARIALIPAGSCFFVFGLMGLGGSTLNLFHLLGAFLGVCLAHNYSIFSSESAASGAPPPVPVRLSGLCAAASFGVLATSRIPVVHALGLTVALIVLTALLAVEIEGRVRRTA